MAPKTSARKGTKRAAAKGPARKAARTTARKGPAKAASAPAPRTLTPYLVVGDAAGAIEWYKRAFGAKETTRQGAPGGKVLHAHLRIGDADLFLSDLFPGSEMRTPKEAGPSVTLHLWHRDVDKLWKGAVENGASVVLALDDQFWGDRYGKLLDPYGHSWSLSYRSKLSPKELDRKREQAMKEFASMAQA